MNNILVYLQTEGIVLTEEQLAEVTEFQKEMDELILEKEQSQLAQAVSDELNRQGVSRQKLIWALLDPSKLSLKDGEVEGLQPQLAALKADPETAFLFDKGGKKPHFIPVGKGSKAKIKDKEVRDIMGLRQY